MLSDCNYDKIKLVYKLSSLLWFIQKSAIKDAEAAKDAACVEALRNMEKDLKKHLDVLTAQAGIEQTGICGCIKK